MSAAPYDIIVVGLGIVGCATLDAAAGQGASALGIDQYTPPHDKGSSHGGTRLLRLAYVEGDTYIPMMHRAVNQWRKLEEDTGTALFHQTGIFYASPPGGNLVQGVLEAAAKYAMPVRSGFQNPHIPISDGWVSVLEEEGGFLQAEEASRAFLTRAISRGASLQVGTSVRAIEPQGAHTRIILEDGTSHVAKRVVSACGPWSMGLFPDLARTLHLERRTFHWFEDEHQTFGMDNAFRPFAVEIENGVWHYGFPTQPDGLVKIADHFFGTPPLSHPDAIDRSIHEEDWGATDRFIKRFLPSIGSRMLSKTCIYTLSPDRDFILDHHPDAPGVVIAAGFSGHGFKFAPVLGEILARLALNQEQAVDITPFALSRFT